MSELKPFKALIYNKDKITDFSKVTCPPYDVISKCAQSHFYHNSAYNFIRLILNKAAKRDNIKNNPYTRAKKTLDSWIKNKILIQDNEEYFYFHRHKFKLNNKKFVRYGIIGLLKLEKSTLGHEKTKAAAKKDRLKLMRQVRANLSPIFVLFPDKKNNINNLILRYIKTQKKPFLSFRDYENNLHSLWRVKDTVIINTIRNSIRRKQIFIADGHHRYTVALKFASRMNKKHHPVNNQPWNYIMSYFTNMDSPGLVILPVHRLIKLPDRYFLKSLLDIFRKYFKIEHISGKDSFLKHFNKKNKYCFGLYFKNADYFYLLRLKDSDILRRLFPRHKAAFHSLDIFVLEELIIKRLLGIKDKELVEYTQDSEQAIEFVDAGKADIAFLVSPTKIEEVKEIALIKRHMPAKSTYFYPKVLSGLTAHKF